MRAFLPLALIGLLCGAIAPLAAQSPAVIDPESAVALALRSNLGIETEELSLELKRITKDTVYNVLYPQIRAEASLSRMNTGPETVRALAPYGTPAPVTGAFDEVIPFSYTQPHTFSLGAGISATLPLSFSMIHGIRIVRQDYEAGRINLETARKQLALEVRKTFYNLLILEESIKLVEQNLAAAETRYAQARANFENGLVDEYTMLSAQVAMESMKPAIEETRNGYRTLLLSFKLLLGLDFDAEIRLSGSIDPRTLRFDAKSLAGRFLSRRLDVQGLVLAGQIAENSLRLQKSYLYPTLTLMYSLAPTFQGDPFGDPLIGGDWKDRSGMFRLAVSLGLDAFLPDSKARNDIRRAEIEREQNRIRLARVLQGAELEVRRIIMDLEKSEKSIAVLELNVRLAEEANRMGQEAYRAGIKDYSQIETTEVNLQEARLNLLREKYNYLTGLLDLEHALNSTLEEIQGQSK